jgi:hypothetical protein
LFATSIQTAGATKLLETAYEVDEK